MIKKSYGYHQVLGHERSIHSLSHIPQKGISAKPEIQHLSKIITPKRYRYGPISNRLHYIEGTNAFRLEKGSLKLSQPHKAVAITYKSLNILSTPFPIFI
jgi:hypothetical protein